MTTELGNQLDVRNQQKLFISLFLIDYLLVHGYDDEPAKYQHSIENEWFGMVLTLAYDRCDLNTDISIQQILLQTELILSSF